MRFNPGVFWRGGSGRIMNWWSCFLGWILALRFLFIFLRWSWRVCWCWSWRLTAFLIFIFISERAFISVKRCRASFGKSFLRFWRWGIAFARILMMMLRVLSSDLWWFPWVWWFQRMNRWFSNHNAAKLRRSFLIFQLSPSLASFQGHPSHRVTLLSPSLYTSAIASDCWWFEGFADFAFISNRQVSWVGIQANLS